MISTSKVYQEIWTETRHENYGICVPFGGVKTEKATQVNGFGGFGLIFAEVEVWDRPGIEGGTNSRLEIPRHVNDYDSLITFQEQETFENRRSFVVQYVVIPVPLNQFGYENRYLLIWTRPFGFENVIDNRRQNVAIPGR